MIKIEQPVKKKEHVYVENMSFLYTVDDSILIMPGWLCDSKQLHNFVQALLK